MCTPAARAEAVPRPHQTQAFIWFTNKSNRTCTLSGFAGVDMVGAQRTDGTWSRGWVRSKTRPGWNQPGRSRRGTSPAGQACTPQAAGDGRERTGGGISGRWRTGG
ncbi:DUF4232 domain-containing protein [Streptomyces sp. NPDC017083]|uniref:DUF4232 domain-containing protein n=1 Tax=unclassified Streptomyces TaxID=2593676 RepID=UPI0037AC4969